MAQTEDAMALALSISGFHPCDLSLHELDQIQSLTLLSSQHQAPLRISFNQVMKLN